MTSQPKESTSAIEIYLHPLLIINISDHFTRAKVQAEDKGNVPRCIGVLYGTQTGKRVELRTSFELVYSTESNGNCVVDKEYVDRKIKDYAQVYEGYELLGWYSTAVNSQANPTPQEVSIHKQILSLNLNDSPLFLRLGTNMAHVDDLPITIFEAEVGMETGDQSAQAWSTVPYFIETELSEQISVDNVIRATTSQRESELVLHYAKLKKAIETMKSKVDVLTKYVQAVQQGTVERDEGALRTIKGLTHRFPSIQSAAFSGEYNNEVNEVLMMTQLAAITKGTKNLNDLIDRWNETYNKSRARFS